MTQLWDSSPCRGAALLLLLAIADFADDRGRAFPSIQTLAKKTRMSTRHVQRMLAALKDKKLIAIEEGKGPHGCNVFWLLWGGDNLSGGGDKGVTGGATSMSPDPSSDPLDNKKANGHESFNFLKDELYRMFKRKPALVAHYDEQSYMLEIIGRSEWESELKEIQAFQVANPKYFPRSVMTLIYNWDTTLDHARNQNVFSRAKPKQNDI